MMPLMENDEIYFLQTVVNMIKLDHDAKTPIQRDFANSVLHAMAALGRHYMELRHTIGHAGYLFEMNNSLQVIKCPDPIIIDESQFVENSKEWYRDDGQNIEEDD